MLLPTIIYITALHIWFMIILFELKLVFVWTHHFWYLSIMNLNITKTAILIEFYYKINSKYFSL
jgi:hypothetical protein